jgi:hypothetical protein
MSDKNLYVNRYKCCIYDNDLKKHFLILEGINPDIMRKKLNTMYGIPIEETLDVEEIAPGIKYIRKV